MYLISARFRMLTKIRKRLGSGIQEDFSKFFLDILLRPMGMLTAQACSLQLPGGIVESESGLEFLLRRHSLKNSFLFRVHCDCNLTL